MFGASARDCQDSGERVAMRTLCGRWVLATTVLASSMAFLDDTVVTLALPAIERDLEAGLAGLQWILNGYLLVLGALILLGGRLGDIYGRRLVLVAGLFIFTIASALAAAAPSISLLIAARLIQGAGAALMIPSSLAVITATFRPEDQGRAIGVWAALTALAVALGPLVGGWLVDFASWRWVFLINLPIGAATVFAALRYVPESRDPRARGRLDLTGAALAVLALGGLAYGPIEGPERGWGDPLVLACLIAGVILLVAFFVRESRAARPMLPLHFFRSRQFTGANAATVGLYASIDALFFLTVIQLQSQVGYSALAAGMALVPVTVLLVLLSPSAGKIASRIGARLPMTLGPLLCAAGALLISRVGPATSDPSVSSYFADVLPPMAIFGLGLAVTVAPLTTAALTALDDSHAGLASGVNTAVARVAGLFGIALLPLVAGIAAAGNLDSAQFAQGFRLAMWVCSGLCLTSGIVAFILVPSGAAKATQEGAGAPGESDVEGSTQLEEICAGHPSSAGSVGC